ncbi:MAG: alpha/beta fold hydrolase [Acidimicrobiales bacterium]|nr:alpha/beta fold hydrolase [Acidimicrobiales bacterium]
MTHTVSPDEFAGHGGTVLRGEFYRPDADGPWPAVAMAHGFSATRTMGLPSFAAAIADAGIAVLLYDHRNFGTSDGVPRQEINPWAQARDYQYALDHLAHHPDVDAERLGLWGSSFSGGEVMVVGAIDRRAKAIVANVPWAGSGAEYAADSSAEFAALAAAFSDRSGAGLADIPSDSYPFLVVQEPGVEGRAFLDQPEASEWFLSFGDDPESTWRNEVTIRNAFGTEPVFDPGLAIRHLDGTPILLIVATHDATAPTDMAVAAYDAAGEPKELLMIEGHHFAPYSGPERAEAAAASARFLMHHLLGDSM